MRNIIALCAAAPLALLPACGEPRVSEEDVAVDSAGMGLETVDPTAELPAPTADALETVDYTGSYSMTGLDGSQSMLTLDKEAGTYTYAGPGVDEQSGTFEKLDNSRIFIEEVGGRPGYFSVADGALYRLGDETSPYDEISAASMFRRDP